MNCVLTIQGLKAFNGFKISSCLRTLGNVVIYNSIYLKAPYLSFFNKGQPVNCYFSLILMLRVQFTFIYVEVKIFKKSWGKD
jgi:hypothetical protein